MDTDPRAGLLPEGLEETPTLADHAPGLLIGAQDTEARGDGGGRWLRILEFGGRGR